MVEAIAMYVFVSAKEELFFFLFVLGTYHLTVSYAYLDSANSSSLSIDQADWTADV